MRQQHLHLDSMTGPFDEPQAVPCRPIQKRYQHSLVVGCCCRCPLPHSFHRLGPAARHHIAWAGVKSGRRVTSIHSRNETVDCKALVRHQLLRCNAACGPRSVQELLLQLPPPPCMHGMLPDQLRWQCTATACLLW